MAQRRVRDLTQCRLGVERDAQPGGRQHVDVVGAIADGDGLLHRYAEFLGEVPKRRSLSGTINDLPDDAAGEHPVNDLQLVGRDVVEL